MIEFSCLKCGRTMKVADTAAGKKGQCKTCGAAITVPTPDNADTDPQPPLVVSQDNPPLVPRATPPALPRGCDGKSILAGRVKGLLATPSTEDSPSPTESVSEESEPKRNIPVEALTRTSNWLSHAVGVTGTATAKIIAGMTTLRPKPTRTERGFDSQQIMAARIAAAGILLVAISPFFRMVSAGRLSALMIQSSVGRNLLISAVIAAVLYGLAMVKVIRRVPTLFVVQSWGILVGFQMGAKIWQISQFDPMPPPDNPFALMFSQQFTFSPGFGLYLGMTGGVLAASAVGLVLFRQLRSDASVALVYAIPCLACIGGVFIVFSTARLNDTFPKPSNADAPRIDPPGAPVGPVVPEGNGEVAAPIADAPQKQAEPQEKPADAWTTAGMTAENETVRVEVESVVIGKVKLKVFRGESSSEDELLQIKLRITSKSDAKKLNYDSWSASHGGFLDAGSLRDDLDNTYKRISFGLSDKVVGQLRSESIYPSKSVSDLLVFEVPIDKAQFLKLMLPVRAYGGRGDDELKLKIPTREILGSSAPVRADDAEDEAVAFVEELKGTVNRDKTLPGKPVIEISLSKTQVTDAGMTKLAGLKNLITLDLGYTQVTDVGLKELAGLKNLEFLGLDETQVTDEGLKELAALTDLNALTLAFTQVTDAGVKELAALKNLTKLCLSDTQVTDVGVMELVGFKNLTVLDLYGTQVTDVGLKELAGLKNLTTLTLSNTKVTDAGVKKLQNALPKCKITN